MPHGLYYASRTVLCLTDCTMPHGLSVPCASRTVSTCASRTVGTGMPHGLSVPVFLTDFLSLLHGLSVIASRTVIVASLTVIVASRTGEIPEWVVLVDTV